MGLYELYHNGLQIVDADSITVEVIHNGVSKFTAMVTEPSDAVRASLGPAVGCGYLDTHIVTIYRENENILDGTAYDGNHFGRGFFLIDSNEVGRNLQLKGFSYEILAINEKCVPLKDFQKTNWTDHQIFDALVSDFSNNLNTPLHNGTPSSPIPAFRAENQNLGNRFNLLNKTTGIEWYIERYGVDQYRPVTDNPIRWGTTLGSPNSIPVELYENKPSIAKRGVGNIINEVTIIGTGDGRENQVRVTMPNERGCTGETDTVNRTCNPPSSGCTGTAGTYNCDNTNGRTSQTSIGVVTSEPINDRGISSVDQAIQLGNKVLDERAGVNIIFEGWKQLNPRINFVDIVYKTGEFITLNDEVNSQIFVGRLKEIKYSEVVKESIEMKVINANDDWNDDEFGKIKRDTLTGNMDGVGATNIWQVGESGNADDTKPLEIDFFIPDDAKRINSCKARVRFSDFRVDDIEYTPQSQAVTYNTSLDNPSTSWQTVGTISPSVNTSKVLFSGMMRISNMNTIRNIMLRIKDTKGNYYPINSSSSDQLKTLTISHTHSYYRPSAHDHKWAEFNEVDNPGLAAENFSTHNSVGGSHIIGIHDETEVDNYTWFGGAETLTATSRDYNVEQAFTLVAFGNFKGETLTLEMKSDSSNWGGGLIFDFYVMAEGIDYGVNEIDEALHTGTISIGAMTPVAYSELSGGFVEVDISNYVNVGAYNTLTVAPSSGKFHRVTGQIFIKCYIESR